MSYLVDTCVLLRAFDTTSPHYRSVRRGLRHLLDSGEPLIVGVQNIAEFWNVATRPLVNNGQGLSTANAQRRVQLIERFCSVVSEDLSSYDVWKNLVAKFGVRGVAVHDARLVATMLTHGIDKIVTLNERDFNRYESEGIKINTPDLILPPG